MTSKNSTELTDEVIEQKVLGVAKSQNFTFLVYPDSSPEDWIEKLETLGQPIAISPFHDKDKAQTGGFKKPHYHVIYRANNNVTADSVRKKLQRKLGIKAIAKVQIVDNIENMYSYLTHESKDAIAKKKHVYDKKDIVLLNNFDIERYVVIDVAELNDRFDDVLNIIRENKIINIFRLEDFIVENGSEYGFASLKLFRKVIQNRYSVLKLYFDGAYQELKWESNLDENRKGMSDEEFEQLKRLKMGNEEDRFCKKGLYPMDKRGECAERCICFDEEE